MKKSFLFFILMLMPLLANANYYDVYIDGIYYKLNNDSKEAKVTMGCTETNDRGPVFVASYAGDVVIPESFTYNGILYTVTSIQGEHRDLENFYSYGAFAGCKDLTSITIPKTIKAIGHQAFAGCTSLKSVYISDLAAWCNIKFGLKDRYGDYYYPNANPLLFAHNLFLNGNKISNLTIPEEVTTIKEGTFIGCNISSVVFHKNVRSIGYKAFDSCNSLIDIYNYSSKITTSNSFIDHTSKTLHIRKRYSDYYNKSSTEWNKFGKVDYIEGVDFNLIYVVNDVKYKELIMEVGETIIPISAPTKKGYTFSGWSEIPEKMPSQDVTITGSFSLNTYNLTYIVDKEEYKVVEVKYNDAITAEPDPTKKGMTFSGWSDIPKKMPAEDVTVTGTFCWSKVTKNGVIYQVYNAENEFVEVLGNENANGDVKIISTIDIDGYNYSVTDIVDYAFKNNTNITSVVIPESVITIGDEAFYGCKNITSIKLGKSVKQIESRAFANIDKLTDVIVNADIVPRTDRTAFENSYIEGYVTLHVPIGCLDAYKVVAPWKAFMNILEMVDEDAKVKLSKTKATIEKGKTLTLKATVTPSDLPDKSVTWKSSNKKVATVTRAGKVKGVKAGTATITCTSNSTGVKATCKVTVGYVKLSKTEAVINKGKTLTLKATVYPSTLKDRSVIWKSSNKNVATVTSKGKVKGVKPGTATITCTSNATGLKTTCKVTVGYVKLDQTEVTVKKGKTVTLKAAVYPSSLKDKSVTWESSNTKVATVTSKGKVKGIKAGLAVITCTSNATGLITTCIVKVKATAGTRSMEGDENDEVTEIDEVETSATIKPFDVYDLSGRKVLHQVTSLDGLPDGIYIVNGKKVLKKN